MGSQHRTSDALDTLVGQWDMVASLNGAPVAGARMTFEWIEDGAYLRERARPSHQVRTLPRSGSRARHFRPRRSSAATTHQTNTRSSTPMHAAWPAFTE